VVEFTVQTAVKQEIKSYSEIVNKKIGKSDVSQDRSKNSFVFILPEEEKEQIEG
jgi:hypothetical protein